MLDVEVSSNLIFDIEDQPPSLSPSAIPAAGRILVPFPFSHLNVGQQEPGKLKKQHAYSCGWLDGGGLLAGSNDSRTLYHATEYTAPVNMAAVQGRCMGSFSFKYVELIPPTPLRLV